jgi:heptosyltransferase I
MPTLPASICILRLSALGDATHVLPLVRAIQRQAPHCAISWVIGKGERALLDGLEGVEFIVYDKKTGLAGMRALWRSLRGRRFDVLLQLQLAARANLLAWGIPAKRRIGYDRARSKEGHGLVINERIAPGGHHVLDAFAQFLAPLGMHIDPIEWRIPLPETAQDWARELIPDGAPVLMISPCSSHRLRNWLPQRYAAVADHAVKRGWRVVLIGGRSQLERDTADAILAAMHQPALDLVGKDTLKQLIALLEHSNALLAPDAGPAHIANAVGTPVIGLYACTDLERSGPYSDRRWSVNRFPEAALAFEKKPATALRWGKRVEYPGVMELIEVGEVIERFDALCEALKP